MLAFYIQTNEQSGQHQRQCGVWSEPWPNLSELNCSEHFFLGYCAQTPPARTHFSPPYSIQPTLYNPLYKHSLEILRSSGLRIAMT
ncbi:hypothetical protein M5D96_006048 [Drosophila gunungcola]|uniref:Uncharacterized protein n=1 Tax=Drosophila gunungcola TaxID=103775 RepID=A0A9Q0BS44_9MUSC|nr:hypothetical protein M5D96_008107 [Drosophila gunungcola]KAI8041779.1 hypothetical protein M5D96_006048 [Drosophila gunungcola]